jgi:putative heme-binding domain-containing protein
VDRALPALRRVAYAPSPEAGDLAMVKELVLAFHRSEAVVRFLADALAADGAVPVQTRIGLLDVMAHLPSTQIPKSWADALRVLLRSRDSQVQLQAERTARALQLPALDETLSALAADETQPAEVRVQALGAVVRRQPRVNDSEFEVLLERLNSTNAPNLRLEAGEIVGQSQLTGGQLTRFIAAVKSDPIISPAVVVSAAQRLNDPGKAAAELLPYLEKTVDSGGTLAPETMTWLEKNAPTSARPVVEKLRGSLSSREERQRGQLAELEPLLSGGDPNLGQQLFLAKATCATCHRVGEHGGLVGPDLTKIGAIRSGRDLIESLVAPSATFAQGYEPYLVTLKDGDSLSGVRVRQSDDTFVLRDASGNEVRLEPAQIDNVRRSQVSIMPEGLLAAVGPEEIRDLLAYLQSLK